MSQVQPADGLKEAVGHAAAHNAPRAYRAAVETVAALACVAPETLHACVLDVDAALEAQSAGLRGRLEEKLEALESKLYKLDATNHALESKLDAVLARLADQGKRPREGDHG